MRPPSLERRAIMTESHSYRMRLDPSFKAELEATLPEDKPGGKAGGLSLLFRRLGYLYLRKPLPAQRWRRDLDIPEPEPLKEDLAETCLDDLESAVVYFEQKLASLRNLTAEEWSQVERMKETARGLTHPMLFKTPRFDLHRGINLIGRLDLLLFQKEIVSLR